MRIKIRRKIGQIQENGDFLLFGFGNGKIRVFRRRFTAYVNAVGIASEGLLHIVRRKSRSGTREYDRAAARFTRRTEHLNKIGFIVAVEKDETRVNAVLGAEFGYSLCVNIVACTGAKHRIRSKPCTAKGGV